MLCHVNRIGAHLMHIQFDSLSTVLKCLNLDHLYHEAMEGWLENKMAAAINVFTQQFYHWKTKCWHLILPQSTVALRVSKNYSKVANQKRSISKIVPLPSFSSFFSSQPSVLMREVTQLKQPSTVRKFPKIVLLCLVWSKFSLCWASSNDL